MIEQGDTVPLTILVTDDNDVPINAGTVTLTVTRPDGTIAVNAVTVTPVVTGQYNYDLPTNMAGRWTRRWTATTGSVVQVDDDAFYVEEPWRGIVSLQDAREHLNFTSTVDDEELRSYILAATDFIESLCGYVVRRTVTQTVIPAGGVLFLDGPVISLTSIVGAYGYPGTYDVSGLFLDGNAVSYGYGGICFRYPVTVTYVAGRTVIPAMMREAALEYIRGTWGSQQGQGSADTLLQGDTFGGAGEDLGSNLGLARWRAEKMLADAGLLRLPASA